MKYNFSGIITQFSIGEGSFEIKPFGSGHINDTYRVKSPVNGRDYLLQKINDYVFKDVNGLMNNMLYVTNHLKQKIYKAGGDPDKEVLTLIPCNNGLYYCRDEHGGYWRMTTFLHNTKSYDLVTAGNQAYQGGVAFGRFQYLLCDMGAEMLVDTIPNFLNIEFRLWELSQAIENNAADRLSTVSAELDFLLSRADSMKDILQWGRAGILPLRITHNDTKFNNILLDEQDNIQCVIDLDTVMPGYVAYDFGDAIRSIISTAAEDEVNLEAIQLNIHLFEEFTKGYLSQTISFLSEQELKSLIKGVLLLPYMQAVRFLTDYLNGDTYYKTQFAGHNLQRTLAQMQLLKMLELNKEKLTTIIEREWFGSYNSRAASKQPVAFHGVQTQRL
ncbi:aminoglycoside phosphotransferase family protein [Mucilaginibacter sp. ZT4R22]|uniref:Aminoglycoside phosphotransferase family protein n=1 Tax=Mucilaginibacter pankratovii TaxID=2772110 RepID=A0ABR7WQA6_9SPHI|nr:aminoglycoside phosphotransferase family protein [Mucilaginibacter pankratovii]MBD1364500.1 aminoglycoside phosphotransferase family protein [Mucilaginibacter pankratovii]